MNWIDVLEVSTLVIASLGGGGAIVLGLSRFLSDKWLQDWKGEIDAKLQRLDAALAHRNFLLQRLAEFELEALTECWRAARACLPLINATRPSHSGTDLNVLEGNAKRLADAHNRLVEKIGEHELFLSPTVAKTLDSTGQVLRLELSNIRHHKPFEGDWWEKGEKNRVAFQDLNALLLAQVQARVVELKANASDE
jgi:hypothetical protein